MSAKPGTGRVRRRWRRRDVAALGAFARAAAATRGAQRGVGEIGERAGDARRAARRARDRRARRRDARRPWRGAACACRLPSAAARARSRPRRRDGFAQQALGPCCVGLVEQIGAALDQAREIGRVCDRGGCGLLPTASRQTAAGARLVASAGPTRAHHALPSRAARARRRGPCARRCCRGRRASAARP